MTPLNGDEISPRPLVKAGNKTFSWLFDTGAAVTCMNRDSFYDNIQVDYLLTKAVSKKFICLDIKS